MACRLASQGWRKSSREWSAADELQTEGPSQAKPDSVLLPDQQVPEEADYEAVPVEAYGLAMLRGMGWKPGKGIGNTFSQ